MWESWNPKQKSNCLVLVHSLQILAFISVSDWLSNGDTNLEVRSSFLLGKAVKAVCMHCSSDSEKSFTFIFTVIFTFNFFQGDLFISLANSNVVSATSFKAFKILIVSPTTRFSKWAEECVCFCVFFVLPLQFQSQLHYFFPSWFRNHRNIDRETCSV